MQTLLQRCKEELQKKDTRLFVQQELIEPCMVMIMDWWLQRLKSYLVFIVGIFMIWALCTAIIVHLLVHQS
jgi:hypothetical protein